MWNRQNCRGCGEPVWPKYCIVFGVGLALSCFCPMGFILFVLAVLLVALGVALLKRC